MFRLQDQVKRFLPLLVALALVRGTIYSTVVPLWQAPDEPSHFEYIKLILERRTLPQEGDFSVRIRKEIVTSLIEQGAGRYMPGFIIPREALIAPEPPQIPGPSELVHPPLYYLLNGLILLPFQYQEVATQAYAARLVSVALSALVVFVAFLTARQLFPEEPFLTLGVPTLVLFIPAHTFMTSTINNDHLAELICSLFVYLSVRASKRGISLWLALSLGLLTLLGIWTKATTLVVVLFAGAGILLSLPGKIGSRSHVWRWAFLGLVMVIGVGIIVMAVDFRAGEAVPERGTFSWDLKPWVYRVAGDWLHLRLTPAAVHSLVDWSRSIRYRQLYLSEMKLLFETFWARFGVRYLGLDAPWYVLLMAVNLASLAGLALFAARAWRNRKECLASWQLKGLLYLFACAVVTLAVVVLRIHPLEPSPYLPHARYLYVAIVPISTLFMVGLREIIPSRWHHLAFLALVISLFLFDTVCLLGYVVPFFGGA